MRRVWLSLACTLALVCLLLMQPSWAPGSNRSAVPAADRTNRGAVVIQPNGFSAVITKVSERKACSDMPRGWRQSCAPSLNTSTDSSTSLVYVVTPTYNRTEQLAELTRLANTLRLAGNVHWILVEDAQQKSPLLSQWLQQTGLPHTHLAVAHKRRGSLQRDCGLHWLRSQPELTGWLYLADDDNAYDVSLFKDVVPKIHTVGVWPVAFSGHQLVESAVVVNDSVVGWATSWGRNRKFAVDMAGFGINLDVIRTSNAEFCSSCDVSGRRETCFLETLGVTLDSLQPFQPARALVWHMKTLKYEPAKWISNGILY